MKIWKNALVCAAIAISAAQLTACDSAADDDATQGAPGSDATGDGGGPGDTTGQPDDSAGGADGTGPSDGAGPSDTTLPNDAGDPDDITGTPKDTTESDTGEPWVNPWPAGVNIVTLGANGEATLSGNLTSGAPLSDLSFASDSSVACFPATQNEHFAGNHVFYAMQLPMPAKSVLDITVTPESGVEVSLYALQMGATNHHVPPAVPSVVACEASHAQNLAHDPNPGEAESVGLQNPSPSNTYNVFFAVAGDAATGTSGAFTVHVKQVAAKPADCDVPQVSPTGWSDDVVLLDLDASGAAEVAGDLSHGKPICELGWAWQSSVACFPETQAQHFAGNHVLYALSEPMPKKSIISVTVTPDPGVEVSLYGFQMGTTSYYVPPFVPSVVTCEASHATSLAHTPNPGVPETIEFQNPGNNPYNISFGVAGDDLTGLGGGYTVTVKLIKSEEECGDQLTQGSGTKWPTGTTKLALDAEGEAHTSGDLKTGKSLCTLSWAAQSTVACFPGTENSHFKGNHVFYALTEPLPGKSTLTITARPAPGVEVSLYGWWMGTSSFYVPPFVPSVGACEASYAVNLSHTPNPGEPESITFTNPGDNPYNIFFAVAGDDATGTAGAFDVDISLVTFGGSHCPESLEYSETYTSFADSVKLLTIGANGEATAEGELAEGTCTDLGFADDSNVACFPATQFEHFEGNHVYYALKQPMPPKSVLSVTAIPDADVEVSLYGYQMGTSSYYLPPVVPSVLACEASHTMSLSHTPNPGEPESIQFQNPTGNSYNVLFAVAGDGATGTSGGYEVVTHLVTSAGSNCPESLEGSGSYSDWPADVEVVSLTGATTKVSGSLVGTGCVDLGFAANSAVACFPATQNTSFEGNHAFFALAEPVGPGKTVTVKLLPAGGVDLNLYGLQTGVTTYFVPPHVPGAVACEAALSAGAGGSETITFSTGNGGTNAYNIMVAVAGPKGVKAGTFDLEITVK